MFFFLFPHIFVFSSTGCLYTIFDKHQQTTLDDDEKGENAQRRQHGAKQILTRDWLRNSTHPWSDCSWRCCCSNYCDRCSSPHPRWEHSPLSEKVIYNQILWIGRFLQFHIESCLPWTPVIQRDWREPPPKGSSQIERTSRKSTWNENNITDRTYRGHRFDTPSALHHWSSELAVAMTKKEPNQRLVVPSSAQSSTKNHWVNGEKMRTHMTEGIVDWKRHWFSTGLSQQHYLVKPSDRKIL